MPITPLTRSTGPTRAVLRVLLDHPDDGTYGYAIKQVTGLPSGSVVPILKRLQTRGWVRSRQEPAAAAVDRPRRTYYRLTAAGRREAAVLLARHADDRADTRTGQEN
jgi:DNA-binding PadR family transcriptional regulator